MFLIVLVFPIPSFSEEIMIPRYSIVYTFTNINEVYFDHKTKEYLTNHSPLSIKNNTNQTTIHSTMLNQAPEINTNPSTSTSYQATDIPQAFKDKKYLNTWGEPSPRIYRYETLKRTHISNSVFLFRFEKTDYRKVTNGLWYDHFTDTYFTNTKNLQIDHIVPVAEAKRSHTNEWTASEIKEFFNTNINSGLLPVYSKENNKKGAHPPSEYLPPNTNFQAIYIDMYVNTKNHYQLKLNANETNIN